MSRTRLKIVSALLTVSLVLSVFPGLGLRADVIAGGSVGDLTWELDDDGTLTISGTGPMLYRPWAEEKDRVENVIISGVTSIGFAAFCDFTNLKEVTISDSVTLIDADAFHDCSSLESIVIPESVTSIGDSAFHGCENLRNVNIPSNLTSIGDHAFGDCENLSSVTIPGSVTSISDFAFASCCSLSSVTMSESIISIGKYAFSSCHNLENIVIPNSVTSIGNYAFFACNLRSITIPSSVKSIGDYAFAYNDGLSSVTISEGVNSIGDSAFGDCYGLESLVVPKSVTSIEANAFNGCRNLNSIVVDKGAVSDEDNPFDGISSDIVHYYYDVTYSGDACGTVTGKAYAYDTESVEVTITPELGYRVDKVTLTDSDGTVELAADSEGKYKFVMPSSDVTVSATFKEIIPEFTGHSLVLAEEIGVRFFVDFPKDFDAEDCYMEFLASDGRKKTVTYAEAGQGRTATEKCFVFEINALELADTISATLHFDETGTVSDTYSAMMYITYVQENMTGEENKKTLDMVNALQAYGYYLQLTNWNDGKASHNEIPVPKAPLTQNDIDAAATAVEGYYTVRDYGDSGITASKFSLTLNSKTAINVSVKPGDNVTILSTGYKVRTIGGETYYQFSTSERLGPKSLGERRTVSVETNLGTAEITTSAMGYVNLAFSSGTLTEQQTAALAAYYYYYVASMNY